MSLRRLLLTAILSLCASCSPTETTLHIDLITTLRPGTDFDAIRLEVGERFAHSNPDLSGDYTAGVRISSIAVTGSVRVRVTLLLGSTEVATQDQFVIPSERDQVVRIRIVVGTDAGIPDMFVAELDGGMDMFVPPPDSGHVLDAAIALDCHDFTRWPGAWAAEEQVALDRMNMEREAGSACAGGRNSPVDPLTMNIELRIAARCHSLDMATHDLFSHTGTDGTTFRNRTMAAGYTGSPLAENIAATNPSGEATVEQWMTSAGHCEAIMRSTYREVGIGYVHLADSDLREYWTAVFGTP